MSSFLDRLNRTRQRIRRESLTPAERQAHRQKQFKGLRGRESSSNLSFEEKCKRIFKPYNYNDTIEPRRRAKVERIQKTAFKKRRHSMMPYKRLAQLRDRGSSDLYFEEKYQKIIKPFNYNETMRRRAREERIRGEAFKILARKESEMDNSKRYREARFPSPELNQYGELVQQNEEYLRNTPVADPLGRELDVEFLNIIEMIKTTRRIVDSMWTPGHIRAFENMPPNILMDKKLALNFILYDELRQRLFNGFAFVDKCAFCP